ncbi:MAG: cell division protein FtsZ [Candidatus Micrarchaeota archaeon]
MFEDIIASVRNDSGNNNEVQPKPVANEKSEEQKDRGENSDIRIKVIGVGGAGCNCVSRLQNSGIKSAELLSVNTDGKHLNMITTGKKLLIGRNITRGLGAGGDIELAKKCADADRRALSDAIGENELIFITAGMGGGTGGGAAPVIAEIARDKGAIVIAMVTYPFALERVRLKKAQKSLQELIKVCDTVVVIDNNRLLKYAPNLAIDKAFALADSITGRAVTGISDTIMFPSLMNIDYADVKSVMQSGGLSMISLGEGLGVNRIDDVIKDTANHPLLDVSSEGAKGALLHLEGGPDLTLGDSIKIGENLSSAFDNMANVKMGARINLDFAGKVRATAIITGVKSPYILGEKSQRTEQVLVAEQAVEYL